MAYAQGYAQTDSRWANDLLGYDSAQPWDLGLYGCLVTAVGNMAWWISGDSGYTPRMVNTWMQDNAGFVPDGGVMYWQAIPRLVSFVTPMGEATSLAATQTFLAADTANYALIEVRAPGQHFVFAPTASQMVDSEDGKIKAINRYTFYHAHLYRDNRGAGGGAVVPHETPVVSQATNPGVIMPSAQDVQNYIKTYTGADATPSQVEFYTTRQWQTLASDVADTLTKRAAEQVASAVSQTNNLQTQLSAALAQNVPVVPAIPETPSVTPETAMLWQTTYKPSVRRRVAVRSGEAVDYAGQLPPVAIIPGNVFNQAGTFVAAGVVQVRTADSVARGEWYGTPESLFDDDSTDRNSLTFWQQFNLWASQLFGQAKHFETTMIAKALNKDIAQ